VRFGWVLGGGGFFGGRGNWLCFFWVSIGLGVLGLWVGMFDPEEKSEIVINWRRPLLAKTCSYFFAIKYHHKAYYYSCVSWLKFTSRLVFLHTTGMTRLRILTCFFQHSSLQQLQFVCSRVQRMFPESLSVIKTALSHGNSHKEGQELQRDSTRISREQSNRFL